MAAELRQRLVADIHSLEPQPTPDQLEDQFRRWLSNGAAPVLVPAPVPTVNKLLRGRVAETQSRQPAAVSSPGRFGSYLSGQQTSGPQIRRMPVERNRDGVGCFSCGKSGHAATRCPNLNAYAARMAGGEDSWGVHYDPTLGVARPTADGKRRLIRGKGFASRVSGTVRPQDPGGGATPVAAPVVPSRISVVLVEETKAGDTSRPECPCDDQER